MPAPPLQQGCPWSSFAPPNVDWCEAEQCAWVVNPSDTWSNLLYAFLGVAMILEQRRHPRPSLALFGPASIFIAISSGIYHASYTYFFQFFDFVSMFVFCFLVIALNAVRLRWVPPERQTATFAGGVVVFSAAVPLLFETPIPIQALVLVLVLVMIGQEWTLRRREGPHPAYRWYALALALIASAALFSALDVTRSWCDPQSWVQGHAIWHLLSALALYALFRFYAAREPAAVPHAAGPCPSG